MEPVGSLPHSQVPATCPYPEPPRYQISCPLSLLRLHHSISSGSRLPRRLLGNFVCFYGEELLVSCPNPKPEDHTLSAVPRRSFTVTKFKVHLCRKKKVVRPSVRLLREIEMLTCNAVALTWRCVAVSLSRWHCKTQI